MAQSSKPLRIAVAVQGRFHAFDLVQALAARDDVAVSLLTNYSARECERFGIAPGVVSSFVLHRWIQRFCYRLMPQPMPAWLEGFAHESFGRWARRELERMKPRADVIRIFSGVAEETLHSPLLSPALRLVTRGSAHIRTQHRLLEQEERRAGRRIDKPSAYMLAREEREYALADGVVVLSSFSRDSFIHEGYPQEKLMLVPNAVNLKWYGLSAAAATARSERAASGAPLRVLMVGSFSFQKGILDLQIIARRLSGERYVFRFVGDVPEEGRTIKEQLAGLVEFKDRVPPQSLADEYAWGDVFLFPTVQDGFPASLSQALASGLPAITTMNGSGPDLVSEGITGWCLAARDAEGMIARLEWLEAHREQTLKAGLAAAASASHRSWNDVAADFVQAVAQWAPGGLPK